MPLAQRVLNMSAGAGYLLALGSGGTDSPNSLSILARAECFVRVSPSAVPAPIAPVSSPAPSAGQVATWAHLLVTESIRFGADSVVVPSGAGPRYLEVWAVGAGYLVVVSE